MTGSRTSHLPSPSSIRRRRTWGTPIPVPSGTAYLVDRSGLRDMAEWKRVWAGERHDHRYYDILDETIPPFEYHYVVLEDNAGRVRAVQPVFVSLLDLLEGLPERSRRIAHLLTWMAPSVARFRTMWVGPSVGEAALGAGAGERSWS